MTDDQNTPESPNSPPTPPQIPDGSGNYEIPPPGQRRPCDYNPRPRKKKSGSNKLAVIIIAFLVLAGGGLVILIGLGAAMGGGMSSHRFQERVVEKGTSRKKVAVIPIYGIISSGQSFFGGFAGVDTIREKLKMAGEDDAVEAIILDINSPGGEVTATDELHHEVQKLRKQGITVITCMRSVAASGGYYMAAGTDYIVANRLTMTGSIGVVIGGMNYSKLMDKLGVEGNTFKSGRMKDMGSPARYTLDEIAKLKVDLMKQKLSLENESLSPAIKSAELQRISDQLTDLQTMEGLVKQERELIQGMVDDSFNEFAKIVAEGRNLPLETVKAAPIGDARILSGTEALKLKLVDKVGYMDDAIAHARTTGDHSVVRYDPMPSIFDVLGGRAQGPELIKEVIPAHLRVIKPGRLYYMNPTLF